MMLDLKQSIEHLIGEAGAIGQKLALLHSADFRQILATHPDCGIEFGVDGYVTLISHVEPDRDIRDYANFAGTCGYAIRQNLVLGEVLGFEVGLTIFAYQSYDQEERALLRDLGLLKEIHSATEVLSCRI